MATVGPIPPYTNPPIQPQFYQPRCFIISDITLGVITTVTTVLNNDYVIGQLVRLIIPKSFGCRQLNEKSAYVISIPFPNQVILNLDSSQNVDPFISSSAITQAQILAIGDINTGVTNSFGRSNTGTYIPGSFINISPN
jgi:hypothetical protein